MIDLPHLQSWIGREQVDRDVAALRHAQLMAATIARPGPKLNDGDPLPPLWHWLYFLEGRPPAELGPDGHPARGGFLPPVPLPNRMWAGGRVEFEAPIPLGTTMDKRSTVLSVEHKSGRSGELVFVTVQHELSVEGRRCIREEHDIVYKGPAPAGAAASGVAVPPGAHQRTIRPDSTLLFRYSALTFNGHRIHYDQDYCRQVEGYDNLVIHGPLVATLLAGFAQEIGARPLRRLDYRGLRPAILGTSLTLNGELEAGGARVWSALPDGAASMQARVAFVP
jgi:3-methylfumaryl-CoA hydratase